MQDATPFIFQWALKGFLAAMLWHLIVYGSIGPIYAFRKLTQNV